jgi:hypothetical protein
MLSSMGAPNTHNLCPVTDIVIANYVIAKLGLKAEENFILIWQSMLHVITCVLTSDVSQLVHLCSVVRCQTSLKPKSHKVNMPLSVMYINQLVRACQQSQMG